MKPPARPFDIRHSAFDVSRRLRQRGGFALLITITLLAFLVLLLVSLSSLTRVETQVATNGQSLTQARQNALMALNIALGQLQKYTGPDQRSTAAADIAAASTGSFLPDGSPAQNTDSLNYIPFTAANQTTPTGTPANVLNGLLPNGATASIQTGTRWWTGVWGRSGTSYATPGQSPYAETPNPILLNWLVSGNENGTFSTDSSGLVKTSSADGRSSTTTAPFTPGSAVNWGSLNTGSPQTWTGAGYNGLQIINNNTAAAQPAVLLVGPGSAGTGTITLNGQSQPAVDRYVVAPLGNVTASGVPGIGNATIGRYAWWVGDQGVKADYTVADPNAGHTAPATDFISRLRLMVASRTGAELVPGFSAYPLADDANALLKLGRLLEIPQAALLDSTLSANSSEVLKDTFNDFAAGTYGVLSDTANGGLRQDLTYYFEQSSLPSPLAGQNIIPTAYSPNWGSSGGYAPTWDWLYSFYNTNPTGASIPVRPEQLQPGTPIQVGISPIITQSRLLVFTSYSSLPPTLPGGSTASYVATNLPLPGGTYTVPIRCNVAIVLANPYDVTLTIPANTYEIVLKDTYTGSNPAMPTDPATIPPGLIIFASDINHATTASYGTAVAMRDPADSVNASLLDQVRFIIPAVSIPPGGNCVLSVDGSGQVAGADTTNASSTGHEDPVTLAVNTIDNPIGGTSEYFTSNTPLKFIVPPPAVVTPPATQPTTTRVTLNFDVNTSVFVTTTLRRISDQAVLQQLTDCSFSKQNLVALGGGSENAIIGNFHTTFLPPARRNMDSSGIEGKFNYALFAYARSYQDLNLRAAIVDHTALDSSLWTPPSYAGGSTRTSSSPAVQVLSSFTQDLTPATWAENFGAGTDTDPDFPANRSPVATQGVFFDFPQRSSVQPPVLSLGELQHASLTTDDWHPGHTINDQSGYAVGNSYSNAFVTRGATVQNRKATTNWYKAPGGSNRFFDMAYLLNTSLWDTYFFSGIPQSSGSVTSINPRYETYDGDKVDADLHSPNAAAHLLTKGAFNINSTSVNAWTALLGGLNGLHVNVDSATSGTPYPRTPWQTVNNTLSNGTSYSSSGTGDDAYAGYRRLNTSEITALATEIVKRVRARGPFVSLAQFINRTIVPASGSFNATINDADSTTGNLASASIPMGRGLTGPLQAAIDSTASGINTFQNVNGTIVTAEGSGAYGDRMLFAGEILSTSTQKPTLPGGGGYNSGTIYFADTRVDLPNLDPTLSDSASPGPQGRTSTGIPGWLLQGDLLQALGPVLSARSDTFVIRTYGEVVNPITQQVTAKAWCEATVQRFPTYIDSTADTATTAPASLVSSLNQTYGRQYKIISFRWLTPGEI